MQNYSSKYAAAVRAGSSMQAYAQVFNSSGQLLETLSIVTGSVTIDYTATNRRSAQLTISDPTRTLLPKSSSDALAPYGNYIKILYGPIYPDGSVELFPLGVFPIYEVDSDDTGTSVTITINCYDASKQIQRAALTDIYTINAGTNYASAIQGLLNNRMSNLRFNLTPTTETTPLIALDINQDPWQAALDMANAIGNDLFFDENGIVTMRPTPDPTKLVPSWTYADSAGYSLMSELRTTFTANKVYNDIIVTGETVSSKIAPVSARAQDNNPLSPTYVKGAFGDIPMFIKSKIITTVAQAQAMANRQLAINLGMSRPVTILGPTNPAQDVQDVIQVIRSANGISGNYTIDKIVFNLNVTSNMMEIDTRNVI